MTSKRFRLASEQTKSEERDFRFTNVSRTKNGARAAQSLTLIPRSLFRNRTETFATKVNRIAVSRQHRHSMLMFTSVTYKMFIQKVMIGGNYLVEPAKQPRFPCETVYSLVVLIC